jgi:endonuclease/exonuclease/phosphatase (EEP) superfamily protein YafD
MKIKPPFLLTNVTLCIFLFSTLLTVASAFGQYDWRLDLLSHFLPWYLLIEAAAVLLFVVIKRWKLAGITVLFLIVQALPFTSLYSPQQSTHTTAARFKLLQFNVCAPAKDYAPLSHYLSLQKPDLVVLEECGDRCFQHLTRDKVFKAYPYSFRKVPHRHRLLVLSKLPILDTRNPALYAEPAVELLTLNINRHPFNLLVMHSTRPSSGKPYYENQIKQFKEIGKLASNSPVPFLMVGDLNTSPWNYSFGLLLQKSKLKNSMDGFGFQPSFPTFVSRFSTFPLIPIDHVLVSRQFQVLHRHTGPRLQSDHLPVVVELGLSEQ